MNRRDQDKVFVGDLVYFVNPNTFTVQSRRVYKDYSAETYKIIRVMRSPYVESFLDAETIKWWSLPISSPLVYRLKKDAIWGALRDLDEEAKHLRKSLEENTRRSKALQKELTGK